MKKPLLLLLCSTVMLASCKTGSEKVNDQNEQTEQTNDQNTNEQWISLFDGETLEGWRSFKKDAIVGWTVENGYLTALGEGSDLTGDIITTQQFEDFELYWEWKISPGGNSGLMFHVLEDDYETTYATGPEYQLLDDEGFPSPLEDWQKAGANYGMHVPENKNLKPVGEFNSSRIIVNDSIVEHWLNGEKILEYKLWSKDWKEKKESGKWSDYPDYGMAKKGHIALQDHGDKIWFRNIRIKRLE